MSETTSPPLQKAVVWATSLHAGQDRDGKPPVPYISHPLDVMTRLRLAGETDPEILVTAVLHDVIEETAATIEDIRSRFGSRVSALVGQLTRTEPDISGLTKAQAYKLRSETLLSEISRMSTDAQKVKLADRCSNLAEAIVVRPPKKLARYVDQSVAILSIIPRSAQTPLWDDLTALVARARTRLAER